MLIRPRKIDVCNSELNMIPVIFVLLYTTISLLCVKQTVCMSCCNVEICTGLNYPNNTQAFDISLPFSNFNNRILKSRSAMVCENSP